MICLARILLLSVILSGINPSFGEENLLRRIHNQINASMSSTWRSWNAIKGVDLNENTDPNECNCCAGAHYRHSWWKLDLGNVYPIKKIIYIGRDDGHDFQTTGFSIYKVFDDTAELIYANTKRSGNRFTIELHDPVALQILKIMDTDPISVCELKLIESEYCPTGSFGTHCEKRCYCSDKLPCNRTTGVCQSEGCDLGWKGPACTVDINLIRRIKPNVTVSMSRAYRVNGKTWGAEKAIDLVEDSRPNQCHCCSATTESISYWRINLGNVYPIQTVIVIGRSDGGASQSRNFRMYGSETSTLHDRRLLWRNRVSSGFVFSHELTRGTLIRLLEFTNPSILAICELKLIEGDELLYAPLSFTTVDASHCSYSLPVGPVGDVRVVSLMVNGYADIYKDNRRKHLRTHTVSNRRSIVTTGLKLFRISMLSTEPALSTVANKPKITAFKTPSNNDCPTGRFNSHCSRFCHCIDGNPCNKATGTCQQPGCEPGWQGSSCSEHCSGGWFGQGCSSECHCLNDINCHHVTGECLDSICSPGWRGSNCSLECDEGHFGQNCTHTCHCRDHGKCEHVDGTCESGLCSAGWRGPNCSGECMPGTFGLDCRSICHCANDVKCNHINGSCTDSMCDTGWRGSDCSIAVQSSSGPQGATPTGAVIGAAAGVIVVVIIIAVIIVWRRRRRQNDSGEPNPIHTHGDRPTNQTEPRKLFEDRKNAFTKLNSSINGSTTAKEKSTYYNYDKEQKLPVYELWDYLTAIYADKCEKLYQEFQQLPQGLTHDCNEARKQENAKKNRYKEMYAYDHSRVVLRRVDETLSSYINACYIDGYDKQKKFIACQGPTIGMVEDFWQMIFQENISLIVMLTNVIENGTRKCIQYWPPEEDEELMFGDVKVKTDRISTLPDYVIRELDVRKTGYVSRSITHAHFTAWPDKDVPDAPWHLVNFWRKIESMATRNEESVVVHCSAGVGRTGTYIALDILQAQAKAEGYIKPFSIVENMRQQRVNMVQTKEQYVFLHEAVAEALHISPSPIKVNEYAAVHESLLEVITPGVKAGLQQQFQLVQEKLERPSNIEYCNFSSVNENDAFYANGNAAASLPNAYSPKICYIQNHGKSDSVVVAELSDAADSEMLLRLIDERKIRTVISLQDIDHTVPYDIFDNSSNGENRAKFKIEHLETRKEKFYDEKLFTLKGRKSTQEEQRIKQFVYRTHATSSAISIGSTLAIKILNAVLKWQATLDSDERVLITYRSALGRAGIMCLLLVEFQRIRDKEEVNLLETVKQMKQRNPRLLSDYEHYKFCHAAVQEYIRQSDVYMNV